MVAKVQDLKTLLIIGYGNPDREDDGVAWHILRALTLKLGLAAPESYEDEFPEFARIDFAFHLQLTPEMAEDISAYEYVCFVDAHTGNIPEPVRLIYGKKPDAALLSVLGQRFLFSRQLSKETARLVPPSVELVWDWIHARKILE
jgi:Ni,Fe-hydrogenase maturation factor